MTDDIETPDVSAQAFFATLSDAPTGTYNKLDRYRDLRAVFLATEQGRRVLHELLRQCGVNRESVVPGPIDPYRVLHLNGRRSIGLWLIGAINHEPAPAPASVNRKEGD